MDTPARQSLTSLIIDYYLPTSNSIKKETYHKIQATKFFTSSTIYDGQVAFCQLCRWYHFPG